MAPPQLAAVGVGLVAALRHQLGGGLGVGHGLASTIVLPHVLRWNLEFCAEPLARAAGRLGLGGAEALMERLETMTAELGLPGRLRDVGVGREDLAGVADHVLGDGAIATNPRPLEASDEVLELLFAAW